MSSKHFSLFALAAFSLILASCVRSASTPPPATATVSGVLPASSATFDPLEELGLSATQTIQAASGTVFPTATPPTAPDDVLLPTATPLVAGTPIAGTPVSGTPVSGTPAPTYAYTPLPKPATYTLQKGEFPYCIARRFNVDPGELLALNGLASGELYEQGQTLQIPQTSATFPGERALIPHPATYTVLSGDTIYSIACKYGDVDPMAIAAANGLIAPYTLTTGRTLQIP